MSAWALLHGDAGLEAHNDVVVFVTPTLCGIGSQGQGEKDVHFVHGSFGGHDFSVEHEAALKYARDGKWFSVESNGPADDGGVGVEQAHPGAVAEDGDRRFTRLVLFRQQRAAEHRLRTKHGKETRLRAEHVNPPGLFAAGERKCAALGEGHLVEGVVLVLNVDVLTGRGPIAQNADCGRMEPDGRKPVGVRIGRGHNRSASTTLKIAELAPMPMAREATITRVSTMFLRSMRKA